MGEVFDSEETKQKQAEERTKRVIEAIKEETKIEIEKTKSAPIKLRMLTIACITAIICTLFLSIAIVIKG